VEKVRQQWRTQSLSEFDNIWIIHFWEKEFYGINHQCHHAVSEIRDGKLFLGLGL
jgi:hypothetical protein